MLWLTSLVCLLVASALVTPSVAAVCPESCVCSTHDGLHRATCSNLAELYKFTLRQKHHNINILDLSHNNITKLSHELDRLTEVVTLDLSTNGITEINKFLHNAKKLVHLNLANNRLQHLSIFNLPASVSSLDLTNNLLQNVPSDLGHLVSLEHLELEGNPLDCSCENIRARDRLLLANVTIDKVTCVSPPNYKGQSWLKMKPKDVCKMSKTEINYLDIMMGDQPIDAERIGEESTALKSMSIVQDSVLGQDTDVKIKNPTEDDDSLQFMRVRGTVSPTPVSDLEGSGDTDSTATPELLESSFEKKINPDLLANEEYIPANDAHTTEDPIEGSGEGSGFGIFGDLGIRVHTGEITTPVIPELDPGRVRKFFDDENSSSTEFPPVEGPSIYAGGPDWHTDAPVTEKIATPVVTQDTTISQKLETPLTKTIMATDNGPTPHKTGTYICIAVIVVLLVGLIGFAIIKGQMRKRRDRRLLRQQKRDIEASKEMVDMNKSLLGKPAVVDTPMEKKVNGKYELVPTHETHQKKAENGDIGNGIKHSEANGVRTDSPRDSNQNKSSSKDHNVTEKSVPNQDASFESAPSPDSRKDTHSLSSEDLFAPLNDEDVPRLNGNIDSELTQRLLNGDQMTDSDFLSPSREYVPVYSPDMGRVRIKMTETPKPKTPVLVNRSRSNAGDIIITPTIDGHSRKSTT